MSVANFRGNLYKRIKGVFHSVDCHDLTLSNLAMTSGCCLKKIKAVFIVILSR